MFDWGHSYVCDGIADEEFGRYMRLMHRAMVRMLQMAALVMAMPHRCR